MFRMWDILNLQVQDVRVANYPCDQRRGMVNLVHIVPMDGSNNKNYLTNGSTSSTELSLTHV